MAPKILSSETLIEPAQRVAVQLRRPAPPHYGGLYHGREEPWAQPTASRHKVNSARELKQAFVSCNGLLGGLLVKVVVEQARVALVEGIVSSMQTIVENIARKIPLDD